MTTSLLPLELLAGRPTFHTQRLKTLMALNFQQIEGSSLSAKKRSNPFQAAVVSSSRGWFSPWPAGPIEARTGFVR
jgi:hypothetical protein